MIQETASFDPGDRAGSSAEVITFEGQNIEDLPRERLLAAVRYFAARRETLLIAERALRAASGPAT